MAAGSLDFGVQLGMLPPDELFDLVRRLEAVGYESVWVGDHLSFHNPLYESLTLLAACASITRRIRLGTAVYLLALRPPGLVAKVTATLDVLSGGRLVFGVGVGGENPKEFALVGVPHRERGARVDEGLEAVRALWRDGPATFRGRFTNFENVSIDPKPAQKPGPPVWIGGRSDAALRRAGRVGDGWVSYVVQPARYARSLDVIRKAALDAGRSLDGFTPSHLAFVTIGRDHERARARWVKLLSARYAQDFGPLAEKYGIIGTPAQCAEQLERFREAGCRHVIVSAVAEARDQREQLEAFAAEVVPRFAR
jgi:probable F420-dependent oxidoreductase